MIKYCSFTGVDNDTSIPDMLALSREFPFIEWGVLFSLTASSDLKDKRYPALGHILELNAVFHDNPDINCALHICGKAAYGIIDKSVDMSSYMKNFKRIQLNVIGSKVKVEDLKSLLSAYPDKIFMTQHNSANAHLAQALLDMPNHQVLFDSSGGRGLSPEVWPTVLSGKVCGYAGGLGPHNIKEQLNTIEQASQGADIWIDMEGKIRDAQDNFSLPDCRAVALEVAQHIALKSTPQKEFKF